MDRSIIFLYFLFVNFLACTINHIDDTDETYGYWEPLHYLVNGIGMQTWEYSPVYAIRTYAFILPFRWFATTLKGFSIEGREIFLGVRLALAIFNAIAESGFVSHIRYKLGSQTGMLTMALMMCSPGLFYSMTSFLPSSVAASLVMLAFSSWLEDHFFSAIACGCVAVLCTGWPFVGLILLPMGFHMLLAAYYRKRKWGDVVVLCFSGATIVLSVAAPPFLIDSYMYNKYVFPTLNILLYNVLPAAGRGDNLYGIEPSSYYVKNLFLNLGLAWPLAILSAVVLVADHLLAGYTLPVSSVKGTVIALSALLWLLLLFLRPHKEERFMYPVYPLLCAIAAHGFQTASTVIHRWMIPHVPITLPSPQARLSGKLAVSTSSKTRSNMTRSVSSSTLDEFATPAYAPRSTHDGVILNLARFCVLISACLGVSRVISSHRNFYGYLGMWQQISRHDFSAYKAPYTGEYLTICMGNEWHYFGSHFFMPSMMRLGFVEEDFHGLLPQYYASVNGTRRTDTQLVSAFNDLNQEDKKKYTHLLACDFVLSSEPATTLVKRMQTVSDSSSTPRNLKRRVTNTSVKPVIQTTVLDVDASRATIARAFYLPGYSDKKNQCKNYTLYHLS